MFMKEKEKQKNMKRKGRKERKEKETEEKEKKKRKKKRTRDSPDPGGSALSHFEGRFPKVLRECIPGFGGKKRRKTKWEQS